MTRDEGHYLLNKIQEGQTFDFDQITAALIATGDIAGWRETNLVGSLAAGMRSQGLVASVQDSPAREGNQDGECLVVGNDREDRENPRLWCSAYIAARYEQGQK
jgi:hypothetical protein